MQKLTCVLFLSLSSFCSFAQTIPTENQKLESLCKVWGFLKYHHPEVTKGKTDWDQQLIKMIPAVISSKDKNDLSNLYLVWIGSLGKVKTCGKSQNTVIPDSLKYNLNIVGSRTKASSPTVLSPFWIIFTRTGAAELTIMQSRISGILHCHMKITSPIKKWFFPTRITVCSAFSGSGMLLITTIRIRI